MLVLVQEMQEKQEIQESCKVVIHGRTTAELNCAVNSCPIIWNFQSFSVSLQHRQFVHSWAAGGLIYEKDVFERLSLWVVNLASSNHHSRQMTTRRLRSAYLYTFYYI